MANMDLVLDTLIRIQNATRVNRGSALVFKSNLVKAVLTKLQHRGFISNFTEDVNNFVVELTYDNHGASRLHGVEKVSKLGRRMYINADELKPVFGGRGMYLVSTTKGLMTDHEARKAKQGGELICKVW